MTDTSITPAKRSSRRSFLSALGLAVPAAIIEAVPSPEPAKLTTPACGRVREPPTGTTRPMTAMPARTARAAHPIGETAQSSG